MSCSSKIVVFDLDETLGYFSELGMFWDGLHAALPLPTEQAAQQAVFNHVLDLFPECLRPDIVAILRYIHKKKMGRLCDKIMVYTNNQGPSEWARLILGYFEAHLGVAVFDQIIAAFKIRGEQVELCRSTPLKTHEDLIKCTQLPEETQICFLDDVFYPAMSNDKIYYIHVKPYVHDLPFDVMIQRLLGCPTRDVWLPPIPDERAFRVFMRRHMEQYHYLYVPKTEDEQRVDVILSKRILQHLHVFFKRKPKRLTRRLASSLPGRSGGGGRKTARQKWMALYTP